jgi:hypothetical protein
MDLRETGLKVLNWMQLVQVKGLWQVLMSTIMNIRIP